MTVPSTLADIRTKIRRITARPSSSQLSDTEIDKYINTYYLNDFPEQLRLESLKYNYQFTTTANVPVYDFPRNSYLTLMPPVYIGGYQSYMTQSRDNFFRINPELNYLQDNVNTGNGNPGTYTGTLSNLPIIQGFKPNPPGAYAAGSSAAYVAPSLINYMVLFSAEGAADATSGISVWYRLVDDGQGNLFSVDDSDSNPANKRGTINYITGAYSITAFPGNIPTGNPIDCQYVPYQASRPQSCVFFQDQIYLYPIPDQAYVVSFEVYKYPTALTDSAVSPQLNEWWQLLAYGASDKIFSDSGDLENMMKYRPLLEEQLILCQRRTIVQQSSERTATIYTEQFGPGQWQFGNMFGNF